MKNKKFKRFEMILLSVFALTLGAFNVNVSAEVVFSEDFSELTVGETPAVIGGVAQNYLSSFAKVVSDNGNNVLVIGKPSGSNSQVLERIMLDKEYKTGVYVFSYKMRPKNHYAHGVDFMRLANSASNTGTYDNVIGVNYWFNHTASNGTDLAIGPGLSDDGEYMSVSTIVDFTNGKYSTTVSKNGNDYVYSDRDFVSDGVAMFKTTFTAQNYHGGSGDASKDSEYYIDDIKVEHFPISVTDKMEDALISDVNQDIVITFDEELSNVTAQAVEIYKDGSAEKLDSSLYTVKYSDKKLAVSFKNGMDYGASYEIKLGSGIKAADKKYDPPIGSTIASFKTKDIFDGILSVADNGKYNENHLLTLTTDNGYRITLKKDGNEIPFVNSMQLEPGEYTLDIEMWSVAEPDKKYQKTISFSVFEPTAPVFEEIKITGEPKVNETLSIDYKYLDFNGDPEGVHEFSWWKSTDGTDFTKVSEEPTYLLTENDVDCYFKVEAYPVAVNPPYKGEKYETPIFKGPFKPIVKGDVTISVNDRIVTAVYEYFDENGYNEKDTAFQWYRLSSPDSAPSAITGAVSKDYTFTDDDVDHYVYCVVTPKKEFMPFSGNAYKSEVVSCLKRPVATNVKLTGKSVVGGSLAVSYVYSDEEDDPEGSTTFEWYVDGSKYSEAEAITLTSSMSGSSVYCVVTPVSKNFPYKGKPVSTEIKKISGKTSSGGGGSSGGGISIGSGSYKPTTDENKNNNQSESKGNKNEFSDINNHWAKDNIKRAVELGFVKGKSENEFSPDANITRAEFAAVIARVLNMNTLNTSDFVDVAADSWYNGYIGAVSNAAYMVGTDGAFRPDDNITREEMCKVIANITGTSDITDEIEFSDYEEISDWAKQAVSAAYKFGIVTGRDNGSFSPKDNSTRAEAVSVILRLYDYMKEAK